METRAPTFSEFAQFIREWAGLSKRKIITPDTLFEDDLGITGDDGCELLEAVENRFRVQLATSEHSYRKTFDLRPNEFLFHPEGLVRRGLNR